MSHFRKFVVLHPWNCSKGLAHEAWSSNRLGTFWSEWIDLASSMSWRGNS
jgi:hypothetical protein